MTVIESRYPPNLEKKNICAMMATFVLAVILMLCIPGGLYVKVPIALILSITFIGYVYKIDRQVVEYRKSIVNDFKASMACRGIRLTKESAQVGGGNNSRTYNWFQTNPGANLPSNKRIAPHFL